MKPLILIITGVSGSGKTVALRALEDAGYFCVDNIPPQMIDTLATTITQTGQINRIAIGIDIREKEFLPQIETTIVPLRDKYEISIIFLKAQDDALIRRFRETRRPHPLLSPKIKDLKQAIGIEKRMLLPLKELADRVIDTSSYTPHQLREHMITSYRNTEKSEGLNITLISFGFKYDLPQHVDLLFDVRFLPNPYFVPELKDLNGTDKAVRDFILEKPETGELMDHLKDLLNFLLPQYQKEGRAYLTIGIGCTGGRHRSPCMIEELSAHLKDQGFSITIIHRDM